MLSNRIYLAVFLSNTNLTKSLICPSKYVFLWNDKTANVKTSLIWKLRFVLLSFEDMWLAADWNRISHLFDLIDGSASFSSWNPVLNAFKCYYFW